MMMPKNIDYATRDYEGFRTALIEQLKEKIPEYTDFSESDVGIVLIELLSYGLDIQSYYLDRVANEIHLSTATERDNVIELCKSYGYTLKNATASVLKQVFEIIPQSKPYTIPKGLRLSVPESSTQSKIYFETMEELEIPANCNGMEKDTHNNYLYTVPVKQGFSIRNEILGSSNGTADQTFIISESPVLFDSVELYVNEGREFVLWTRVDTFMKSKPNDRHYTLSLVEDNKAMVKFGNGSVGKIPEALDQNIKVDYRVGGGSIGNVTTDSITVIESNVANLVSTTNISTPEIVGTDVESLEDAKRNAIIGLRTLEKAVTLQDYEDLAYNLNFTDKAKAEEVQDGRTINIYILPKYGDSLTEMQIEQANALYHERKMLGTKPVVMNPVFKPLNLKVTCKVNMYEPSSDDINKFKKELSNIITDYFKLGNFDFAQPFSNAHLVYHLLDMSLVLKDVIVTETNDIGELTFKDIITLGTLDIEVK